MRMCQSGAAGSHCMQEHQHEKQQKHQQFNDQNHNAVHVVDYASTQRKNCLTAEQCAASEGPFEQHKEEIGSQGEGREGEQHVTFKRWGESGG